MGAGRLWNSFPAGPVFLRGHLKFTNATYMLSNGGGKQAKWPRSLPLLMQYSSRLCWKGILVSPTSPNMLRFPPAGQLMPKHCLSALKHKDQEGKFKLMFLSWDNSCSLLVFLIDFTLAKCLLSSAEVWQEKEQTRNSANWSPQG